MWHTEPIARHALQNAPHNVLVVHHRCFQDGQYEQAVGIAIEARHLDKLEQTIKSAPDMVQILTYSLKVCQALVISRDFREQVLHAIACSTYERMLVFIEESHSNENSCVL